MTVIDKDALMDDLISLSSDVGKMGFEWLGRDDVIDTVRWQDEYELDEWFDMKDDQPENKEAEYIVTIDRNGRLYTTTAFWGPYLGGRSWIWSCDGVIAWRYMPEPYRRESNG